MKAKFIKIKGKPLAKIDVIEWKKMTGPKKYILSKKSKWEKTKKQVDHITKFVAEDQGGG